MPSTPFPDATNTRAAREAITDARKRLDHAMVQLATPHDAHSAVHAVVLRHLIVAIDCLERRITKLEDR